MSFVLPPLPYEKNALEPHISEETVEYHYGKHNKAYVDNLNNLILGTEFEKLSLEEIIRQSSGSIFNNAAQIWNHEFYWNCFSPDGGGTPKGEVLKALEKQFGSFDAFKDEFSKKAIANFGSGWTWLIKKEDGSLAVLNTDDADNPLTKTATTSILGIDIWEHSYYIDYRNLRGEYIKNIWNIINWKFVEKNLLA